MTNCESLPTGPNCIDCGHPTSCGVAHGAGHDHSPEAKACTSEALAVDLAEASEYHD